MTRKQRPTASAPADRQLPMLTIVGPGASTVTQRASQVSPAGPAQLQMQLATPQAQLQETARQTQQVELPNTWKGIAPTSTVQATAMASPSSQSNWLPLACNNGSLPEAMDDLAQQLYGHSISCVPAEPGQSHAASDATRRPGAPCLSTKTCEACRNHKLWCCNTGDQLACCSCAASHMMCSYVGAPPSALAYEPCFASCSGKTQTHIVPAAHGHAFEVRAGSRFRIVDLHGEQVVDFMAWCLPFKTSAEHLSMSYTRHAIGGSAPPQVGECLYTNRDEPMFRLIADTVKTHDMLYMACNPGFYKRLDQEGHRSCATNVAEAMTPWGMESWLEVVDPFNVFQNTPYYTLKALGCSRAGDYVELEALKDAVCAVSSCPYEGDGFNGGKVTEVAVVTGV